MARLLVVVLVVLGSLAKASHAQSTNAAVGGQITDQHGGVVPGVTVVLTNLNTGVRYEAKTNGDGFYDATNLPPGIYRANVTRDGFKSIVKSDIELHVQDQASINFQLQIGSVAETVTVEGGAPLINTQDAAVSTVVDRQFVENLPLNGRSFQTLIQLTPGVVLTAANGRDSGEFSINGQRASSNYWMVDGVSANIGIGTSTNPGNGPSGSVGAFSVLGGTNSLVSVDALQEFRIQTSTYAPEFGRTPGGQISIVTRSGTKQWHGTLFDYFRNDVLDANNWFNGFQNNPPLPKAKERQNDFGGTFSGPILKDRSFFFFSYEGLRLRLPQTTLSVVPDQAARAAAVPAMRPYFNAYPFDPNQPDLGNGVAQFNASYSNPASLDAYSLRLDHRLTNKFNLFARYNFSPSRLSQRGSGTALSVVTTSYITIQTGTAGVTWVPSPALTDDFRFNYSRVGSKSNLYMDNFGGAAPVTSIPFPAGVNAGNGHLNLQAFPYGSNGTLAEGLNAHNIQRQINIVDSATWQKGTHGLKFGIDYRRLTPIYEPYSLFYTAGFASVAGFQTGKGTTFLLSAGRGATFLFRDLGVYGQDTWRATRRLTLTYGFRWDINFTPQALDGPDLPGVTGYSLTNFSNLAIAPAGTPPFKTSYGNVAPRVGLAYQLRQSQDHQTVLRGGFGVFYDVATSEFGNQLGTAYPYGGQLLFFGTFPQVPPIPVIAPPTAATPGLLLFFNPDIKLPYTLEWNFAVEQGLGRNQTLTASYIGAAGRRLLQTADIVGSRGPTTLPPNISTAIFVDNFGTSDYDALQVQFQRRLSRGLQALASYTWSHSIDDASAGSLGVFANTLVGGLSPNANRGPSDFDIRHAFTAAATYDVPAPRINAFTNVVLKGWSLENIFQARSAPPVTVNSTTYNGKPALNIGQYFALLRPNVVPGQPLYLYGPQYPGGKRINPAAFTAPPIDPSTGKFIGNGNLGRNALRGFGLTQWDFAVHRDFALHEAIKLQFRAEMFNVLNHPNFGQPDGIVSDPTFGLSTAMLGQYLSGGQLGRGAFSPLYQVGGPRSIQLALKFQF